jgi:hypothetical protein
MHKKTEQQLRRRRYYLHRKIKGFARLKAAARIAFIAAADTGKVISNYPASMNYATDLATLFSWK